jgi:putative resolvase
LPNPTRLRTRGSDAVVANPGAASHTAGTALRTCIAVATFAERTCSSMLAGRVKLASEKKCVRTDGSPSMVNVARLTAWATENGFEVGQVVCEVGSGLNGKRPKLRRVLSDPDAKVIVVEHRDRLARFGVEHLEAGLAAQGRRIVVADPGESTDDLVREVIEVLTSMCARLYGDRGARNRAMRAITATKGDPGEAP